MAKPCNSKSQKQSVFSIFSENSYKNCKFKLDYPPTVASSDEIPRTQKIPNPRNLRSSSMNYTQTPTTKKRLKFQCHFEERKRRAELRRKKLIQKLKRIYQIDVDGLDEYITRDILLKAELLEKEKRERDKRKAQRSMVMITRLLEEQKTKRRGVKECGPLRKIVKKDNRLEKRPTVPGSTPCFTETEETIPAVKKVSKKKESSTDELPDFQKTLSKLNQLQGSVSSQHQFLSEENGESQEEKTGILPACVEKNLSENVRKVYDIEKVKCKKKPGIESYLESTPKKVIFKDYEKNKIYLQDLKITNISCETIHCRYLGIVVHTKTDYRFPVGVAIRDNVKLRPGLSCSTKIRLCSQDDTKKLECSIVYETRRAKTLLQHSWFLVPVACTPIQAIIKVTPLKIIFPTLSWCDATGPERAKLLCKVLKIENSGSKGCYCKISNTKLEEDADVEIAGEEGEFEKEPLRNFSDVISEYKYQSELLFPESTSEEFIGEDLLESEEAREEARLALEEIFDAIFAVFRFSQKFCIEIPPLSTVLIQVRFIPQYKGFHHETYFLQFDGCENIKEQPIELIGDIKRVPLRVEPLVIDLKICVANSGVYSGTFKVFNDSKAPLWVVLKVPSSVKNHAHVYPGTTVIMPFGSSYFSVRVYPRVTLARDAPRYYNEDSQIFEFPIFIHPGNIRSCKGDYIKIYVMALVTDYSLELSPPFVNFGSVSILETVRTELELTNHSLAAQEYGFLNLPKGVRVEPNFGFGTILPKETITLYLLYSPQEELLECEEEQKNDEFQVNVTSVAKYGGFREKLETWDASFKPFEIIWEEPQATSSVKTNLHSDYQDFEEYDECDENSSLEGEELCLKIEEKGSRIREFLKLDRDETFEFPATARAASQDNRSPRTSERVSNVPGEVEDEAEITRWTSPVKRDLHIVNCHAVVIRPRCRLSDSVIQLPATPCSSFSLYRFRLTCIGEDHGDCICGFRKPVKKGDLRLQSQIHFEFRYACPHFKLEPESGILKPGNSIPITVVYNPQLPDDPELENKKEEKTTPEMKDAKESISDSSSGVKSKKKQNTPKFKASGTTIEKLTNTLSQEMKNSDYLAGGRASSAAPANQPSKEPFIVESRVQCVVKTISCEDSREKFEVHEMVMICPIVSPKFTYLGSCPEINFDKVFIGTKSKMIFQVQNVSLERISPSATFLNPSGPFYCPAGVHDEEVDPEHIWRQPLTYKPLQSRGVERQFFEIFCGSTNLTVMVSGEGITPEYKISPNFACCQLESKPGSSEDLKLEVENHSVVTLNLSFRTNFLMRIPGMEKSGNEPEDEVKVPKKERTTQKEEVKDKKKPRKSGSQNCKFWDEIPEMILSSLQNPDNIDLDENLKIFILSDAKENSELRIPPMGKQQIKLIFIPPPDKSEGVYAFQFSLMLERACLLKEMLAIGKVIKGNNK